jgi:predicted regulator of Ras-like GTPase activity (Roadblock/LC7/MglB family)
MSAPAVIVTSEDHSRFTTVLRSIGREANARFVFLLDKAGQQIASAGDLAGVDPTSLASLTAGNVAATEGVASLVGEDSFTTLFHEGKHDSLHISVVASRVILLVVFDERSSLGLVRLRVAQHTPPLEEAVREMLARGASATSAAGADAALAEITEADIDALFGQGTP